MRTIDIDLQTNLVTITPATDREIDLGAIAESIHDAGFNPGPLHLRALGTLEPGERGCFRIRGWSRCIPLGGQFEHAPGGEFALEADVEAEGESLVLRRARVAVRGT